MTKQAEKEVEAKAMTEEEDEAALLYRFIIMAIRIKFP